MKNVITDVSAPAYTIGLDLGDRAGEYILLDVLGEVVGEGRVQLTPQALTKQFEELPRSRIVIEVGTHSPWISRLLGTWHEVIVANARTLAFIAKNKRKSDKVDKEFLARIGRADVRLLQEVKHRSEQAQTDLVTVRGRAGLVKARTMVCAQVRGLLKATGYRLGGAGWRRLRERVIEANCGEIEATALHLVSSVEALTAEIDGLEKKMARLAEERYPVTKLLQSVPGVGLVVSLTYALSIDDPRRFQTSRAVGAYFGMVPGRDQSGENDPEMRITKLGDKEVRRLLVQAAHSLVHRGPDSDLQRWARERLARGGKNAKKRTIVAVARKLGVLLHRLWVTGEVYDPFYESKRRAAQQNKEAA